METQISKTYLPLLSCCLLIILSFLVPNSSCDENPNLKNKISSCLIHHNINNFTLYSSSNNGSNLYFDLLNFSMQNLRFSGPSIPKPVAIILPDTQEQLAGSVICCRKGSLEIRVRSGGHSYEGSSSVATDGTRFVVIDLMNLDRVSVDLESETAWVEGGATLGQTYYAIAEKSSIHGFPAGACPTVGVGGHFSGGGFGFMSRKYGLAADNIVDAIMVNAKGQLLDREGMGEDVFWAIRGGGGGNWGIVYAWKIKLVKVPKIVTAFIVTRVDGAEYEVSKLLNKWQYVAPMLDDEFHLLTVFGAGLPPTKGLSATFQGSYLGPQTKALSMLNSCFPELGIVEEDCKEMSWIEFVFYLSDLNGGIGSVQNLKNRYLDSKSFFKSKSDYIRKPVPINGIKVVLEILKKEPRGCIILEPYGGFMQKTSSESIAFPHRGNVILVEYAIFWNEMEEISGKSKEHLKWIRGLYDFMTPYVSSAPRAAYVNYIDFDLGVMDLLNTSTSIGPSAVEKARVWGEKYFLKNYARLVKAKTLIDPSNVFRHQQSVPPMSSSAEAQYV